MRIDFTHVKPDLVEQFIETFGADAHIVDASSECFVTFDVDCFTMTANCDIVSLVSNRNGKAIMFNREDFLEVVII